MNNELFVAETFSKLKDTIRNINDSIVSDIYAISFWRSDNNDDPRLPLLTVGYNTISRWSECTPKQGQKTIWPIASSSDEAKWNFAFWLQNEELIIGGEGNPTTEWVKKLPFYYTDEEENEDFDKAMEKGREIQNTFIQIIIKLAKMLYSDGVIFQKFGKEIPIIIHELEYYEEILNWTKEANPKGLITEFEIWINSL